MANSKDVMVINKFWVGILSSALTTFVVAGVTYAFVAYGQAQVMKRDIRQLQEANLPDRITRIEQQVKDTKDKVDRIDDKLDKMLNMMYTISTRRKGVEQ